MGADCFARCSPKGQLCLKEQEVRAWVLYVVYWMCLEQVLCK